MGTISSMMTEDEVEGVKAVSADLLSVFHEQFKHAVGEVVLEDMVTSKRESFRELSSSSSSPKNFKDYDLRVAVGEHDYVGLLEAAPPCTIIKAGSMEMRHGGTFSGWTKYHFEARNKSDNHSIFFYHGSSEVAGKIHCFGYSVESLTLEDEQSYGRLCLKLVPAGDSKGETYLLRCGNESSYKEWEVALSGACRRARPPIKESEFVLSTFYRAFTTFRNSQGALGGTGGFRLLPGTPVDVLSTVVGRLIQLTQLNEPMERIRAGRASNEEKEGQLSQVLDMMHEIVRTDTEEQWALCVAYVSEREDDLRKIIRGHTQVVKACISKIRKAIAHEFESTAINLSETLGELKLHLHTPLMNVSVRRVTDAYLAACVAFYEDMKERCEKHIETCMNVEGALESTIDAIRRKLDQTPAQMGFVKGAQKILWDWYAGDLMEIAGPFCDEHTPFEIYCDILDDIIDMVRCAIYTLSEFLRNGGGGHNIASSLYKTLDRMRRDISGRQRRLFRDILHQLGDSNVQEQLSMLWTHRAEHIQGEVVSELHGIMDSGEVFSQSEMSIAMKVVTVKGCGEGIIRDAVARQIEDTINIAMGSVEPHINKKVRDIIGSDPV